MIINPISHFILFGLPVVFWFQDGERKSKSHREFRDELTERVHMDIVEAGKLGQQLNRSSKSHEVCKSSISILLRYYFFNLEKIGVEYVSTLY